MGVPTVYYNLIDLLQNIAAPTSDPNIDVMGETMMDYWRRDAQRLLPSIRAGEVSIDETFGDLLQAAAVEAQRLRSLREQHYSRSASRPTSEPVQYAQDAAKMIDALIDAIRERAAK